MNEKEFYNVLVYTPRYKRTLMTVSLLVLVIWLGLMIFSRITLHKTKPYKSAEEFMSLERNINSQVVIQLGVSVITIIFMHLIAHIRRQERIIINGEGILHKTFLRTIYIPFKEVKDIKIRHTGTSWEKAEIKAGEKSIPFDAFMLETGIEYKFTHEGVLDLHGNQITHNIKKSKLYKELTRRIKVI